jgi:hypothetical protein
MASSLRGGEHQFDVASAINQACTDNEPLDLPV